MKQGSPFLVALCVVMACGHELELPPGASLPSGSAGGATSLVTGDAGESSAAASAGRLNLPPDEAFVLGGAAHERDGGPQAGDGGGGPGSGPGGGGAPAATGGTTHASGGGAAGAAGDPSVAGSAASGAPRVIFSEYVEANSNKALELFALEKASLDGCELETYFNGKREPSRLALRGELAQGAVQVLCSTSLATARPELCGRSTNLAFNGDDAVALRCAGALLDVIGQIGVDPGQAWGGGATIDHSLRRRCDVSHGRLDGDAPFEPSTEWLSVADDIFADLGQQNCAL
jgi:hypothetical protein